MGRLVICFIGSEKCGWSGKLFCGVDQGRLKVNSEYQFDLALEFGNFVLFSGGKVYFGA